MDTQKANYSVVKIILGWVVAVVTTSFLSSAASSLNTLAGLKRAGLDIPMGKQLDTIWQDFTGLGPLLGACIALGFLVAFGVAALCALKFPKLRLWIYIGAGMTCMLVMFTLMEKAFFGTPIIQGARTPLGVFIQMLCGGVGGLVFTVITKPRITRKRETQTE